MEEVFEGLSDMYSIEVHAMPPVLAHCAIPCCLELGVFALQLQREHFHGGEPFEV